MKLSILKKEEFIMDESYCPEKTVKKITFIIEEMLLYLSIKKNKVLGIGRGTVGPIDRENGIILNPKGFFNSKWINVPMKAMFEESLSFPCFIDNGANTAIFGEYFYGKCKDLKSVAYIHCGIGLRSAIIKDGIIIRTINAKTKDNNGSISEVNYREILKSELLNNKDVVEVINKGAESLGIGLANLVRLLNTELVILSGPLIMNFEHYYEKSIETFHRINPMDNKVVFSKGGRFQQDVIALGAAAMVMEFYLKSI